MRFFKVRKICSCGQSMSIRIHMNYRDAMHIINSFKQNKLEPCRHASVHFPARNSIVYCHDLAVQSDLKRKENLKFHTACSIKKVCLYES